MNFSKIIGTTIIAIIISSSFMSENFVPRALAQNVQDGLDQAATETYGSQPSETNFAIIIGTVVRAALGLVGVIFFVLLTYSGILWMTAQGNNEQVEKAKKLMIGSVVGLAIALSAYVITKVITDLMITKLGL